MPTYRIDEIQDDSLVTSHVATGDTAENAVRKITGRPLSSRALQAHWFRVVNEREGIVYEYSYADHNLER